MGWEFTQGLTRAGLIDHLVRGWETGEGKARRDCLAHTAAGNTLWSVWEYTSPDGDKRRYIRCDLMAGKKSFGWGYKDMDESMHPYYYTCPLAYLDMVPAVAPNDFCEEWRVLVRKYWQDRALNRAKGNALQLGQVVKLVPTCSIPEVTITSLKPLWGEYAGKTYRIPRKLIAV